MDDANEEITSLRANLGKAQSELQALRNRYDKDMVAKSEELEDLRRRLSSRIAELEDSLEQARSRVNKLEKEKNRLSVELKDITIELEGVSTKVLYKEYMCVYIYD